VKKNIFIVAIVSFISFLFYVVAELLTPLPIGKENIEIQIPTGASFRQAAEIFEKENVLRDKNIFIAIGRVTGLDRKIRAGYYSLFSSMNLLDLLNTLRKGQIIEYSVTIVEGDSLEEISEKLSEKGIAGRDELMTIARNKDLLFYYDIDAPSIEGYIFPDTYSIPKGMTAEDAVSMMLNKMRATFSGELLMRAASLGLTQKEVLTLASIIEKEAVTDDERPLISAVYHNRLKKKIRLQADPTSIYGVKRFSEKITLTDLKRKTPYNTYMINGLPPGPIASPGIKSIMAALYPADVPYLFFVSNNDGTHQFSVTAREHEAAVRAFREKKLREKQEKSSNCVGTDQSETS
jgi:UPF0755 protein